MTEGWLIVGISGASGAIYGVRLLEALKNHAPHIGRRLIMTSHARRNISLETRYTVEQVRGLADVVEDNDDMTAPVSSGSFRTLGMAVAPCSMRTLAGIAHSSSHNLLVRAADVTLKERRKLVLTPRETPLHKGHLELMVKAADLGAVVLPPFPAFYHNPKSVDDIVNHTVGKILDQFDVEHELFRRWKGGRVPSSDRR